MEHKVTGKKLRQSQTHLAGLISSAMDAVIVTDEQQRIVIFNPAAERMFGYSAVEMVSQPLDMLLPDRFRKVHRSHTGNFSQSGVTNRRMGAFGAVVGTRRNGKEFPIEVSISQIVTDNGKLYTAILRDITERKQVEEALREREQQLRLFVEHSPAAIAMLDCNMRYMMVSHRWLSDYRLTEQNIIGRSHYEIFPEIPEHWKEIHRRCLGGAIEKSDADVFTRSDGSTDWLRWEIRPWHTTQGNIGGLIIFSEVITERMRAEETMRLQASALQAADNAILICDIEGSVQWINQAFTRLTGYDLDEVAGKNPRHLVRSGKHDQAFYKNLWDTILAGNIWAGEIINRRKDGNLYTEYQTISPVRDIHGKITHFIAIKHDITDRKRAEDKQKETLIRVQTQLQVIGKVAVAESLLSGNVDQVAREITELASQVTGAERVNVWLFNEDETELHCIDLYEASSTQHSSGMMLKEQEYVNEFQALKKARYVAADDPLTDPRTAGYVETYLKPLRITSMLDTVIHVSGKNFGLLCIEHVDKPHHWENDEIVFAGQLADKLGIAIVSQQRRHMEAVLQENEERYRIVTRATNDIIWDWNIVNDFHWVSENFQVAYGYHPEEIETSIAAWYKFLHQEDREKTVLGLNAAIDGGDQYWTSEYRLRRADGSYAYILDRGYIMRDASGNALRMIGAMADISSRKAAEEKLKIFRTLIDRSNDIIEIVDPENGRLLDINGKGCLELGYSREELLNLSVFDIDTTVDWDLFATNLDVLRKSGILVWEGLHKRKDGSTFPVEVNIKYVHLDQDYIVANVRDITERRLAEQKIRSKVEYLGLLDQITRAIGERQDLASVCQEALYRLQKDLHIDFGCLGITDQTDFLQLVASVGDCDIPEFTHSDKPRLAIAQNGLALCLGGKQVYEPDISGLPFPLTQSLATCGMQALVMAPLQIKGTTFGMLITARKDPQGFSSGECEFLRQLGDHIALAMQQAQLHDSLQSAYNDLRETQQVILQQERLRALGQMASGIAHDINNALSPVALFTESILETEQNLSTKTREHLLIIQRAVDDVAQTIDRMRNFYRQRDTESDLKPVVVNPLIKEVLDLCRSRFEMTQEYGIVIEARTELASGLPEIMGVESEIREALTNLVFNAVDAMPEGGAITLRTRIHSGGDAPHSVIVEVIDTGQGMDENTRQRCLEPFFTTKGERGTGLGLAMVFGMVQRHAGDIEIDSTPGTGTTMRLSFPAVTGLPMESEKPSAKTIPTGLRLLVVDDDPILLKTLQDILETDGHFIVTADNGQNAIDTFLQAIKKEPFDAVITDLGMPYVDGRQVAAAVKTASSSTPVILLTGWGRRMLAENDLPPHVDFILGKPPKLQELRDALAHCCGLASGKPDA